MYALVLSMFMTVTVGGEQRDVRSEGKIVDSGHRVGVGMAREGPNLPSRFQPVGQVPMEV